MREGAFVLLITAVFGLAGCSGPSAVNSSLEGASQGPSQDVPDDDVTVDPTEPDEIDELGKARWESSSGENREWTVYTFKKIDTAAPDLIKKTPGDIENFCPSYPSLRPAQKKNFWIYLLSAMAELESNFNPALNYTEDFTDSSGRRVVSRGLLQLSMESGLAYGCPLKKETDLNSPTANLDCALRIINRWIKTDGVIRGGGTGAWKGGARYWAVLRKTEHYERIRGWTKLLSICH